MRIVVADDHAIVRTGIRALLDNEENIEIVAEADDGRKTLEAVLRYEPDVLLIDLTMPHCNGLETIARIRERHLKTKILVLTMHSAPEYVKAAFKAGAHGYVVKGSGLDDLVHALHATSRGERFLDRVAAKIMERFMLEGSAISDDLERLSPREREILQLVAEGHTNREIADILAISPRTADTHRTNLMRKLDLHNAQALTRFALRRGLLKDE
jgi:DNA-binding NarL/FixJ family response regulator